MGRCEHDIRVEDKCYSCVFNYWERAERRLAQARAVCRYLRGEVERLEGEVNRWRAYGAGVGPEPINPLAIDWAKAPTTTHPGESWQTTNDSPFPKDCGNAEHEPYITTFDGGWYCSKCSVTWEKTPDVKPGPDVDQDAYREAGDRWGGIP